MSGWVYLTSKEREVVRALIEDGIEVQRLLQQDMLRDTDPRTLESDVERFIKTIMETEEPMMLLEGLRDKLNGKGGENDGRSTESAV